jgi:hypothetical protein
VGQKGARVGEIVGGGSHRLIFFLIESAGMRRESESSERVHLAIHEGEVNSWGWLGAAGVGSRGRKSEASVH